MVVCLLFGWLCCIALPMIGSPVSSISSGAAQLFLTVILGYCFVLLILNICMYSDRQYVVTNTIHVHAHAHVHVYVLSVA